MAGQYVLSDEAKRVLEALENPKYQWRTLEGLSQETGLGRERVLDVLEGALAEQVVTTRDGSGRSLYTTRQHYYTSQGLLNHLLTVLSDQIK